MCLQVYSQQQSTPYVVKNILGFFSENELYSIALNSMYIRVMQYNLIFVVDERSGGTKSVGCKAPG